jgi:hypothetical protein
LSREYRKEKKERKRKKIEGSVREGSEDGMSARPGEDSDDWGGDEEEIKTGEEDAGLSKTKGAKKKKGKGKSIEGKEKPKELRKDMYKVFDGSALMVLGTSLLPFYTI